MALICIRTKSNDVRREKRVQDRRALKEIENEELAKAREQPAEDAHVHGAVLFDMLESCSEGQIRTVIRVQATLRAFAVRSNYLTLRTLSRF